MTKTLEYAYDDYAVALMAKQLNDDANYEMLMKRSKNYKNVFDPSTELMRDRLANGGWVNNFNPEYPYYEYMYRESNAWQSSFFAPHDTEGLIGLYKSRVAFERQLDRLFPFRGIRITSPRTSTALSANILSPTSRITDLPISTTSSANKKNHRPF